MELDSCIRQLSASGVGFTVKHPGPSGEVSTVINAENVSKYCSDPDAFWAAHYGVTPTQYRLWHDNQYGVFCSGYTVRDERCRALVTGGSLVGSPRRWVALQGQYCRIHENGH